MEDSGSYSEFGKVKPKQETGEGSSKTPSWGYDTTSLKSSVASQNTERGIRVGLMLCGVLTVGLLSQDWRFGLFAALVLFAAVQFKVIVARLPKRVGRLGFAGVLLSISLGPLTHVLVGLYLWVSPSPSFMLLSVLLSGANMLSTLSPRNTARVVTFVEGAVVTLGVVLRLILLPFLPLGGEEQLMLVITLVLMATYFLYSLVSLLLAEKQHQTEQIIAGEDAKFLAVGRLTGGIAHDFNNMLTAVLGNLELARLAQNREEQLLLITEAETAAKRGAQLTRELLALAGRSRVNLVAFDVRDLIDQAIDMTKRDAQDDLRIDVRLTPALPKIRADRVLLGHVLNKLLDNAIDACRQQGHIVVSAYGSDKVGKSSVTISVSDNGPGISQDMRPFVFEPYFTTKPVGEGSGLGLPMAKGVVEQLGGKIDLLSDPGKGTEVLVHLPAVPE